MRFSVSIDRAVLAAALMFGNVGTVHAANQYVVISAEPSLPALPVGQLLKVGDEVVVPAGFIVTLLGEDGSVAKVEGPDHLVVTEEPIGTSDADRDNQSIFERLTTHLLNNNASEDALGVTRSVEKDVGGDPGPWSISVKHSGNACIQSDHTILTRLKSSDPAFVSIFSRSGELIARLNWARESTEIELLPDLAARASKLEVTDNKSVVSIQLYRLPKTVSLTDHMHVMGWLLDHNCTVQAVRFARSLSTP